ncbi:MAG: response regulator transcription factor [Bacteroidota bacterium]
MNHLGYLGLALFFAVAVSGQTEKAITNIISIAETETAEELSLSEWKRFKGLVATLEANPKEEPDNNAARIRNFSRDSLHILEVKLMAVKLLEEKQLLELDLSENEAYYYDLIKALRESAIPPVQYQFLEERMALLHQKALQQQLVYSRWLNAGLVLACLFLLFGFWRLWSRSRGTATPVLSKQEQTVCQLILQGKSNKEIANELFISLSTVKTHITNLYAKLNVANRQELLQMGTGTST